jgi:hypothetical protein
VAQHFDRQIGRELRKGAAGQRRPGKRSQLVKARSGMRTRPAASCTVPSDPVTMPGLPATTNEFKNPASQIVNLASVYPTAFSTRTPSTNSHSTPS